MDQGTKSPDLEGEKDFEFFEPNPNEQKRSAEIEEKKGGAQQDLEREEQLSKEAAVGRQNLIGIANTDDLIDVIENPEEFSQTGIIPASPSPEKAPRSARRMSLQISNVRDSQKPQEEVEQMEIESRNLENAVRNPVAQENEHRTQEVQNYTHDVKSNISGEKRSYPTSGPPQILTLPSIPLWHPDEDIIPGSPSIISRMPDTRQESGLEIPRNQPQASNILDLQVKQRVLQDEQSMNPTFGSLNPPEMSSFHSSQKEIEMLIEASPSPEALRPKLRQQIGKDSKHNLESTDNMEETSLRTPIERIEEGNEDKSLDVENNQQNDQGNSLPQVLETFLYEIPDESEQDNPILGPEQLNTGRSDLQNPTEKVPELNEHQNPNEKSVDQENQRPFETGKLTTQAEILSTPEATNSQKELELRVEDLNVDAWRTPNIPAKKEDIQSANFIPHRLSISPVKNLLGSSHKESISEEEESSKADSKKINDASEPQKPEREEGPQDKKNQCLPSFSSPRQNRLGNKQVSSSQDEVKKDSSLEPLEKAIIEGQEEGQLIKMAEENKTKDVEKKNDFEVPKSSKKAPVEDIRDKGASDAISAQEIQREQIGYRIDPSRNLFSSEKIPGDASSQQRTRQIKVPENDWNTPLRHRLAGVFSQTALHTKEDSPTTEFKGFLSQTPVENVSASRPNQSMLKTKEILNSGFRGKILETPAVSRLKQDANFAGFKRQNLVWIHAPYFCNAIILWT